MGCEIDCVKIFDEAPEDKTRADFIDQNAPGKACEMKLVSHHCDQVVDEAECVVRLVIDDTHITKDENGVRLKSSFMSDACSFGSSSLRLGKATKSEFQITLDELLNDRTPLKADGTRRELIGYVFIPVKEVRAVLVTQDVKDQSGNTTVVSTDAFGVYATGLPNRPNHADILSVGLSNGVTFTKSARNRAARTLTDKVSSSFKQTALPSDLLALGI